jgi:hypothetical protein
VEPCAQCKATQEELEHQSQLRQLLETRFALLAQQMYHQEPQPSPSQEMEAQMDGIRRRCAWLEGEVRLLRSKLQRARDVSLARIATRQRLLAVFQGEAAWDAYQGAWRGTPWSENDETAWLDPDMTP